MKASYLQLASITCSTIQVFGYILSVLLQFMANGDSHANMRASRVFVGLFLWVGAVNICLIVAQIVVDIISKKISRPVYILAFVNVCLLVSVPFFMLGLI